MSSKIRQGKTVEQSGGSMIEDKSKANNDCPVKNISERRIKQSQEVWYGYAMGYVNVKVGYAWDRKWP